MANQWVRHHPCTIQHKVHVLFLDPDNDVELRPLNEIEILFAATLGQPEESTGDFYIPEEDWPWATTP